MSTKIFLYDTTLRDGAQSEDVNLSATDKVRIARQLDYLGMDYIEGGWPGANPVETEFFKAMKDVELRHAKLAAFGSTHHPSSTPETDPTLNALVSSGARVAAIFGKSCPRHVEVALGISRERNLEIIGNSISSSFENAFNIPPIWSTVALVAVAAVIVLRRNATVKVLDVVVPLMAACYFFITLVIILLNVQQLPAVFGRIFSEAFGLRQAVSGGLGAVIMNGAKRGLFSNEAGSGSAPCAAAAAHVSHPAKAGLMQALGVFIDTLLICSCTAMVMLLTPASLTEGLEGMDLLQAAMGHHLGAFGVVFIAVVLWLFSFSTFLGILFYARSNVAYLFGDSWRSQTAYKLLALVMLFVGGLAAYQFVWDLGDVGIGLMTIFNMIALLPLAPKALASLRDYEQNEMKKK